MTVEDPYGTIKSWMGTTHFKILTLKNMAIVMALHVRADSISNGVSTQPLDFADIRSGRCQSYLRTKQIFALP